MNSEGEYCNYSFDCKSFCCQNNQCCTDLLSGKAQEGEYCSSGGDCSGLLLCCTSRNQCCQSLSISDIGGAADDIK